MRNKRLVVFALTGFACFPLCAVADTITMGTAGDFAVLGGSTVTNTGTSLIDGGHIGLAPGSSITGFPPGVLSAPYAMHIGDMVALQAQFDLETAYNAAAGLASTQDLTGQNLGGLTLTPGVYFFSSSAFLTGALTLNYLGDPSALFVFQIASTLVTASDSQVTAINAAGGQGCNVFWQVGSSATLGTRTSFAGHILALESITMTTDAGIHGGSALAINGAVTLDTNVITNVICADHSHELVVVPLPSAAALGLGLMSLLGLTSMARRRNRAVTA
jgi:hypothetical protein